MSNPNDNKKKVIQRMNALEVLRDTASQTQKTIKEQLIAPMPQDIINQILARQRMQNRTGEVKAGESLRMNEVMTGQREKQEALERQLMLERQIRDQEHTFVEKRTNELRLEIQAIHQEVLKIAASTPGISKEVEVAAIQAPSQPSVYELNFLRHIFNVLKDVNESINDSRKWLAALNQRSSKKGGNWVQNYKKNKGKYLLSGEHYLTRSAG